MTADTEELLMTLLWLGEKIMIPSWSTFFQSFEGWEYRNGIRFQARRLERRQLVERIAHADGICYQITELGRLKALGGRAPVQRWNRPWDGKWRMIVFDIPAHDRRSRRTLLRWLHQNDFGCLQDSAWITPDPISQVSEAINEFAANVETLTTFEAHQLGAADPQAIVQGAWKLKALETGYDNYLKLASALGRQLAKKALTPAGLVALGREERAGWQTVAALDPLLPRILWPKNYRGEIAWRTRRSLLSEIGKRAIARMPRFPK